ETVKKLDQNNEKPVFVKLQPSHHHSLSSLNSGKSSGAYLGTIPDYTSMNSENGVKLSGVKAGGPAEKAGLQAGDIIIRLAEINVNNLYDYTYAIRDRKPGEKVFITIIRDGAEKQMELVVGSK